ncbi:MAG: hypothetical protein R2911_41510 [Caldilineaceae bacterium]
MHAVERILQEQSDGMIVLGSTQIVLPDENLAIRLQQALQPFPTRVLLLPTPDMEESVRLLDEREDAL